MFLQIVSFSFQRLFICGKRTTLAHHSAPKTLKTFNSTVTKVLLLFCSQLLIDFSSYDIGVQQNFFQTLYCFRSWFEIKCSWIAIFLSVKIRILKMTEPLVTFSNSIEENADKLTSILRSKTKLFSHQIGLGIFKYSVQHQTAACLTGFCSTNSLKIERRTDCLLALEISLRAFAVFCSWDFVFLTISKTALLVMNWNKFGLLCTIDFI